MAPATRRKPPSAPSSWHIQNAVSEWQRARATLLAADPTLIDDEVRLGDLLKMEEAAVDAIAIELVRISIDADYMIDRIDKQIADLKGRREKFETRYDRAKEAALRIIEALGSPTLREHDFTASKGRGPGGVHIIDADLVPDEFCKIETVRTPIKSLIGEAIDDGRIVPGAVRTNGAAYLRINPR